MRKEFTDLMSMAWRQTYVELSSSRLKAYINDTTDWSTELYQQVKPGTTRFKNISAQVHQGNTKFANHICELLRIVDNKNQNYDRKLWTALLMSITSKLATQNAVRLDKTEDLPIYMKDFLDQLIRKLDDPNSNLDPKMRKELKMDIQELMTAFGAKTAAELPGVMLAKGTDLYRALDMVAQEIKRYTSIRNLQGMATLLQKVVDKAKGKFPQLSQIMKKYAKPLFGVVTVL